MNRIIRKIKPSDNSQLAKVIRDIFIEHNAPQAGTVYSDPTTDDLYSLFQKNGSVLFVIDMEGKAVGCGGIYPTPGLADNCAEFVKFYIAPEARNLGLGKEILELSIEFANAIGYRQLYIESLPHYAKAVAMYEKLGFYMLDNPLGESGHPACNIWMQMDL